MYTNRLVDEKSPYLLQHAHNPVDWYPWGEAAFEKARKEDKPIFLSIGYSTCHWCHVMERESFESEDVAAVLNRSFVAIKLDREERPDIDRIYMMFVQATTGSGGWPMSVWLTPELKPFFGGTYFPPDNRYGRPGFKSILEYLANAWITDRAKIMESGREVLGELEKHAQVQPESLSRLDHSALDSCYHVFRRMFDSRLGGFGSAPKFPRPVAHNFLFRYGVTKPEQEAIDMVLLTLREMAKGGMYDQIGGGFHRYSVDDRWFVPHFEKMLYDQAQLATSYLEAFQITGDRQYAEVAADVFDYVLRDMTHPEGGFYSAEDADSVIDAAHPHEKGEGAFYVWSQRELEDVLGRDLAAFVSYRFGCEADGNVRNDPHEEFRGKNILYQARTVEETARRFNVTEAEVKMALASVRPKLMEARARRVRPHLDDKILTAWNGLMISAFALGAQVLGDRRLEDAARRAADFLFARMRRGDVLLRRFRDGDAAIPGFLDDYAFYANALVDLYETVFEPRYLHLAAELAAEMCTRFEDRERGGFFSAAAGDASVVLQLKDDYDGAEPSGNSMAVMVLVRLAAMLGRDDFKASAERALGAFGSRLRLAPHSLPQMLVAYMQNGSKPKQIILAGDPGADDMQRMLAEVRRRFLPYKAVMISNPMLPLTESMIAVDGKATAYVCENFACQLPTTDFDRLVELLQ
ncbi:MAG: thioredoxin domain-containing protein [Bryobacteraceae bacterium]